MKNYLYKFVFRSGMFENYFYKQILAENEKTAIITILSHFKNISLHQANLFIGKHLGLDWSVEKF